MHRREGLTYLIIFTFTVSLAASLTWAWTAANHSTFLTQPHRLSATTRCLLRLGVPVTSPANQTHASMMVYVMPIGLDSLVSADQTLREIYAREVRQYAICSHYTMVNFPPDEKPSSPMIVRYGTQNLVCGQYCFLVCKLNVKSHHNHNRSQL